MEVKFGTEEGTCEISPPSVQRVAHAGRETSKLASELIKYRRLALRAMLPVKTVLSFTLKSECDY